MERTPALSLIIPVLSEAETINESIHHIRELDAHRMAEIIVVDGDPGGSTICAVTGEGVRTAVAEKGRARQMNHGAAIANGAVLVFLHADTLLPSNAFALIRSTMNDKRFVGGAFDLGFNTKRTIFRITELYVFLRTRLTKIPFGDQAIFIRRDFFEEIGGYRDIPIMEDVEIMQRIKKRGKRIRIIPEKVLTSTRRYEQEGIVYATLRNWMLQLQYALGVSPERLARRYKS
ncbi:MAG: TIGR04283 family arsenosugar biosynthesis glycosyltransferase [Nitrospirae bacterium]|nr:TIGR04283 family arsenosugar biosynthesis glycosyltransferase [Nitrospirota bacterium]